MPTRRVSCSRPERMRSRTNRFGKTASDLAKANGHADLAALLRAPAD